MMGSRWGSNDVGMVLTSFHCSWETLLRSLSPELQGALHVDTLTTKVMFQNYNDSQRPDHDPLAAHYGDLVSRDGFSILVRQ